MCTCIFIQLHMCTCILVQLQTGELQYIADSRLQLQILGCNRRCLPAIADARLQLQNYSVAIADSKYTLQALRPGEDRSKNSSIAIADCKYTLQALRPGETAAPPSIADTPKDRAAFQGGQNVLFTPLGLLLDAASVLNCRWLYYTQEDANGMYGREVGT